MSQKLIYAANITKSFGALKVINDTSVWVKENEFMTILGPSGCGKTTLLRILAGFEQPDFGQVLFKQEDITALPPYEREINTVFQEYALFPHMNVFENIAYGLKIKKLRKQEIRNKVDQILKVVNLEGYSTRRVNQLSGGQKQRVAIARALVNEPKVLLLDEPLGALDLKLRKEMQSELKRIQQSLGITFVYVTHDQEEALTMSDKIIVMNNGRIQQVGRPIDIYNEPENAFVANFIGESNIIKGRMKKDYEVELFNLSLPCLDKGFLKNEVVDVVIRPEDIKIVGENSGIINGIVKDLVFKGVHYEMIVDIGRHKLKVHSTDFAEIGAAIGIDLTPDDLHIMKQVEAC